MLLNCGVGKDSWESLGLQGDPTNPKGNQPKVFIGRTDAEAPTLWPPDVKSWLTGRDPDAGKDWRQEKRVTEGGWMSSFTQWIWVWANSRSLLKLMSVESVKPSNHLILCHPLILPPFIFPSIWVFSNESVLQIRWPKYLALQLQDQSFQWIFRTDFL